MSSSGRDAAAYTPRLRGEVSRLQEHFLDLFATTGVTSVVEVANGFDEEDFIQVFDSDLSEVARGLWQRCEAHCDRACAVWASSGSFARLGRMPRGLPPWCASPPLSDPTRRPLRRRPARLRGREKATAS